MGLYAEWPLIEFSPLNNSHLSLSFFSRDVGNNVAELLLREIAEDLSGMKNSQTIHKIDSEEQLSWVLQVTSYALTLPYSTDKEHGAMHAAVRIHCTWLDALCKGTAQKYLPDPMKRNSENYIRIILNSLRTLFIPRNKVPEPTLVAVRQAQEIENVLSTVVHNLENCDGKYCSIIWPAVLQFLLNAADLLLSGQTCSEDVAFLMAPKVTKTLLDQFLCAARLEQIPSPPYWKTLSFLSKRWRHQVSFIENWARKVLSLSVLIVQEIYGGNYCPIIITDEQVKLLAADAMNHVHDGNTVPVLHVCWFQLMHMIGNPAAIISFDPRTTGALSSNLLSAILATGGTMDSNGNPHIEKFDEKLTEFTTSSLKRCFFMACATLTKLVDIFYGDSRISIEFRESDELMQHWSDLNRSVYEDWFRQQQASRNSGILMDATGDASTFISTQITTGIGISSGIGLKNTFNVTGTSKIRGPSDRPLVASLIMPSSVLNAHEEMPPEVPKPNSSQFVWHYLQNNGMQKPYHGERQPKVAQMLDIFMDWLVQSSLVRPPSTNVGDVAYQRSMNSSGAAGTEEMSAPVEEVLTTTSGTESGGAGGNTSAGESNVSRQSFAYSLASSGDGHSALSHSFEWLEVDGISAGRAAALGALCRITCSKASKESIGDSQLAQFYKVVYEALLEKDRLMLCALIYFGNNIFRLALKGVEILLPHFVQAIETVYTESVKLRLHPSIDEIQMRRAALNALSSIISWPTTFGNMIIGDPSREHGSAGENLTTFIEIRPLLHRVLIFAIRNEDDPMNIYLILAMCTIMCEESCLYDFRAAEEQNIEKEDFEHKSNSSWEQQYCVSMMRSVVSAICDNIWKPHWSSELSVCLAALDCLNAFSNMHKLMLFQKNDVSTGFLVVTSLCRFIDAQLTKPPPFHSKDLHSSVVAAYASLSVWLCAVPLLLETESCLTAVAETIEFGLTGGKNLPPSERKAASKRVNDAAENLLYTIFSTLGHSQQNDIVDEKKLMYKFGSKFIDVAKFRHFLIRQETLLSIYEATGLSTISKGRPSLFIVLRSPHHTAHTLLAQLHPGPLEDDQALEKEAGASDEKENGQLQNGTKNLLTPTNTTKFFHIPADFEKPHCKLDTIIPPLQLTPEADRVIAELADIRKRMSQGESCLRVSDDRNVWLRDPLSKELSKLAEPPKSSTDCNAFRVLLYDLGLISEESYKAGDILFLDASSSEFYYDLHNMVDRSPTRLLQSVHLFYVRDGQHNAMDILSNAMNLENTSSQYCSLLADLGEGVEVRTHPHWTGDWNTAFSAERELKEIEKDLDHYIIDGQMHCLWWTDPHIEITFTTPTERLRKEHQTSSIAGNNQVAASVITTTTITTVTTVTSVTSSDEHSDSEHTAFRMLHHNFGSRALSQSSNDERSAGRTSGCSEQSNKILAEVLPPPITKSNSGMDAGSETKGNTSERFTYVKRNSDQRVFVIYLERIEDMNYFPYEEMFGVTGDGSPWSGKNSTRPDLVAIFISQVESELVQVNMVGDWTKCGLPGPLIDGCLVSNSALSSLLRHTIISIVRRRTVELENFQLVTSRRRRAIQDFARKYATRKSYCDFVHSLLEE